MRLERQQHHVLWAGIAHILHGAHGGRVLLAAILENQAKAVGIDRGEVLVARYERDVLAGNRKLGTEVAADRAGTDHRDLHRTPPRR